MMARWIALAGVLLGSAATFAFQGDQTVSIITLGDSITKGWRSGVAKEETFSAVLEKLLASRGIKAQVTNVGIGGERTDQALKRFEKNVAALKPAMVTIMYGANDSYIDKGKDQPRLSKEQFEANLNKLLEQCKKAGIKPILMTSNTYGRTPTKNGAGNNPNDLLAQYMETTRKVAKQTGTPLVDHFDFWTTKDKGGNDIGKWTTDQLHPNAAGHQKMAELILPVVLEVIGKK
jgi:lysophospholipase L1-like esterase